MFKFKLSKDGKYLYATHNPTLRADLQGNVYGGAVATSTAILAAAAAATAGGMYSARQARKAAESQQEAWEQIAEPQKEYMRQMYPMQLEQMREYIPLYKEQIAAQRALLPYGQRMFEEQYYPAYTRLYGDIEEYGAEGVQPWEREAIGVPFTEARTRLGERAAGAGVLGAGPTQKLATLYDIAEAEALMKLPYARKERALEYRLRSMGYAPSVPAPTTPGQIGVGIPAQPAPYTPQGMDWGSIGKLIGMGGGGETIGAAGTVPTYTPGQFGLLKQASQVPYIMMQ